MRHAVVERVPEIPCAARFHAGLAIVVAIASEVGLARTADAHVARYVIGFGGETAVVAISFVVAGTNHIGVCEKRLESSGHRSH